MKINLITTKRRRNVPHLDRRGRRELADDHLQVVKRFPDQQQDDDVRY